MAVVRMLYQGQAQYAAIGDASDAALWMTDWRTRYSTLIRATGAMTSVSSLYPAVTDVPADPPAHSQFTWLFHMEGEELDVEHAADEANMALTDGSVLFTGVQNSTEGMTAE